MKKNNKIQIIPAVMPQDYEDLVEHAAMFVGLVPYIQLDIMDGKFVPGVTWPHVPGDQHFKRIETEEEGMPQWESIDFEVDLMIANPEHWVPRWVLAGARRIIVHVESMRDFELIRESVPVGNIELGLAINTTTPLSAVEPYLDRIDFIQCMGIEKIGFQGQPFDGRVIEHIKTIRARLPEMPISVDGSVNFETAQSLVDAGATRLVSGSAILENDDVGGAIRELQNLVQ
jgi:ribulose-phosphate 3-epimerase